MILQISSDAQKFYEAKIEDLDKNLKDLETIVQGKSSNLRVVEDGQSSIVLHLAVELTSSPQPFERKSLVATTMR